MWVRTRPLARLDARHAVLGRIRRHRVLFRRLIATHVSQGRGLEADRHRARTVLLEHSRQLALRCQSARVGHVLQERGVQPVPPLV